MYLLFEHITSGFNINSTTIISLFAILCGTLVIISKNPIVSVLYLIGLFLCIACYLMLEGTNFIGLSYLLVYVGAVSILFLFILMLINIRVSELSSYTSNSIPLCIMIGFIYYSCLYNVIPGDFAKDYKGESSPIYNLFTSENAEGFTSMNEVFSVISNIWDGNLSYNTHITTLGNIMYTNYFMWLILSSIILLLAMVGAIIITIKQKN